MKFDEKTSQALKRDTQKKKKENKKEQQEMTYEEGEKTYPKCGSRLQLKRPETGLSEKKQNRTKKIPNHFSHGHADEIKKCQKYYAVESKQFKKKTFWCPCC